MSHLTNLRLLLALTAIFGVLSAQAGRGTLAFFTDSATSTGNTFTTGSVDLQLASFGTTLNSACSAGTFADTVASALFTSAASNKAGDIVNQALCIKNAGSLNLNWGLTFAKTSAAGDDPLGKVLVIRIYKLNATTETCTAGVDANGAAVSMPASATELLAPAAILTSGGVSQATITSGANTALSASGATQKLCVSVVVPQNISDDFSSGATSAQNRTFAGTFTFLGTQA